MRRWAKPWRAHESCTTEPKRVSHTAAHAGVALAAPIEWSRVFYPGNGAMTQANQSAEIPARFNEMPVRRRP